MKFISHLRSDEMPYLNPRLPFAKASALNYKKAVAGMWYAVREHIELSACLTGAKPPLFLV